MENKFKGYIIYGIPIEITYEKINENRSSRNYTSEEGILAPLLNTKVVGFLQSKNQFCIFNAVDLFINAADLFNNRKYCNYLEDFIIDEIIAVRINLDLHTSNIFKYFKKSFLLNNISYILEKNKQLKGE